MAEEKKRFPWWLLACAVVLVLIAAVLGFVEMVGRRGTLVGRYEQIRPGMSKEQVGAILGPERPTSWIGETGADGEEMLGELGPHLRGLDSGGRLHDWLEWQDGPAMAYIDLVASESNGSIPRWRTDIAHWSVVSKKMRLDTSAPPIAWRIRRWAEKAYTVIHGPRR